MDPRLQLRVQRYGWDAAATHYDDGWRGNLEGVQQHMLSMADLAPGQQVLETAAGTGLVTFPAARAVTPGGHVTATDLSGEMITRGTTLASAYDLPNITFDRQNAEALSFPDASFDRALCALGLMYMPDPDAALREMKRTLRAGGRATVAVWGERRNCGWAAIFPITDARVQSEVCPMFFGLGAPGALRAATEGAGFTNYAEARLSTTLHFASDTDLLAAVIDGGPVAMAAKRFDAQTRTEVETEFLASVAAHKTGEAYEIPGEFVIATATA